MNYGFQKHLLIIKKWSILAGIHSKTIIMLPSCFILKCRITFYANICVNINSEIFLSSSSFPLIIKHENFFLFINYSNQPRHLLLLRVHEFNSFPSYPLTKMLKGIKNFNMLLNISLERMFHEHRRHAWVYIKWRFF